MRRDSTDWGDGSSAVDRKRSSAGSQGRRLLLLLGLQDQAHDPVLRERPATRPYHCLAMGGEGSLPYFFWASHCFVTHCSLTKF